MKKILFAVAGILASMTVSAQVWVGGSLGFSSRSYDSEENLVESENEIDIDFSPTIGYAINDKMDAGIELSLGSTKNFMGEKDATMSSFGVAPFVRYNFFQSGKISFLAKASADFYTDKWNYALPGVPDELKYEEKYTTFGIYASPLIKYQVTDHIALVAEFAELGFTKVKDESTSIQLDVDSDLYFGIYYAF